MTPERRDGIRHMIEAAKRNHAKRSHLQRELTWATVEQLQHEMRVEARAFWPTPIIAVSAALAAGSIAILFASGVI